MSKHTPGPWVVLNTHDIFTNIGAENADGDCAPYNDGWHVADCGSDDLNIDEIRANARLIAAAPNLLAALQEVVAEADAYEAKHGPMHRPWVRIARAAIAKAEGRNND